MTIDEWWNRSALSIELIKIEHMALRLSTDKFPFCDFRYLSASEGCTSLSNTIGKVSFLNRLAASVANGYVDT